VIVGSGLLAQGFVQCFAERGDVWIYAAGVSNSSCVDFRDFNRERLRLLGALDEGRNAGCFIYFSTCSAYDLEAYSTPYVQHKLAMEGLVEKHLKCLIVRLPQVVGKTTNPHTLLNYLFSKVSQNKPFHVWSKARRNIIDIDDIVSIVQVLVADSLKRNMIVNVANSVNYSIILGAHRN